MVKGEINALASKWRYVFKGGVVTCDRKMRACGWKDSTGERIINAVSDTVGGYLAHAHRLCDDLDGIDTSYLEERLSLAYEHLKEKV